MIQDLFNKVDQAKPEAMEYAESKHRKSKTGMVPFFSSKLAMKADIIIF